MKIPNIEDGEIRNIEDGECKKMKKENGDDEGEWW
jgi:hypothetical protein